jgi:hypothetical protein
MRKTAGEFHLLFFDINRQCGISAARGTLKDKEWRRFCTRQ